MKELNLGPGEALEKSTRCPGKCSGSGRPAPLLSSHPLSLLDQSLGWPEVKGLWFSREVGSFRTNSMVGMQGCIRSQPSSYLTQSKSYASKKGEQGTRGVPILPERTMGVMVDC